MDSKFPELRIGKEISIIGVLWYDRVRTRTKEEFLMRRRWEGAAVAGLALVAAMSMSLVSFAKEERTKVGTIGLTFASDIQAGESGGTVDVTLDSGECSIESVDIVNEGDYWIGGDKPKVEIWLSADSDYYFSKSGKNAFKFDGDKVKYVSSSVKSDKSEMVLTVTLEKLDEDDEDLDVDGLIWDEDNGIAHWDHLDLAKTYKVRLCRRGNSSSDDGIGTVYTVKENSFDFSGKFPRTGTYYFKVRAIDARNHAGDWEESSYIEITDQDLVRLNGQWMRDDRGCWYVNTDGSYTKNNWQYIHSKWYFFDEEGYMRTGWISWGDKQYYCDENGAMLSSTVTPDGFTVGADGARAN